MECLHHTAAWFPACVSIAGRRIGVPTLGHWRLLECAGSPFALGGDATPADTVLALAVLSRPWRSAWRMLRSPWRRGLATLRGAPQGAAPALQAWLRESWWRPDRFEDDSAPRPAGDAFPPCAPASIRLAAAAVSGGWLALCPDAPRSVWDAPIPQLLFAQVAFGENAGDEYDGGEQVSSICLGR